MVSSAAGPSSSILSVYKGAVGHLRVQRLLVAAANAAIGSLIML